MAPFWAWLTRPGGAPSASLRLIDREMIGVRSTELKFSKTEPFARTALS
jgi:hypothetical protein